jgi:hypothetical protein
VSARFQFTQEMKRHVMAMRKKGCSIRLMAEAIGCSSTTLLKQRLNLGSLRRRFTATELRRMVAMRQQSCTIQQIATVVDAAPSVVSRHVSHLGPVLKSGPFKLASEVSAATRRRVVALRRSGYSYWKIANITSRACATVRAIVLSRGRPPKRKPGFTGRRVSEQEVARIIALRRAGSSYSHIAEVTGVKAGTVGKILRKHGFSGRITLVRMAGPLGSRVRGICRVSRCGVRHYGSGLCSKHAILYRKGRIDKNGRRRPSLCEACGKKLAPTCHRRWCLPCRRSREWVVAKRRQDYLLGYVDKAGRPLPLTCEECGGRFPRGKRVVRFCHTCRKTRAKRQSLEWNRRMRRK